jgi:hypothetical protein
MHGRIELHIDSDSGVQNHTFYLHIEPKIFRDESGEKILTWIIHSKVGAINLMKDIIEVLEGLQQKHKE